MKLYHLIVILILYINIGCKNKQPKEVQSLDFETIEVNQDFILNPIGSVLFDSILIYRDKTDKYLLSAINLSDLKEKFRFLKKGNGPKELLNVFTFLKFKHRYLQVYSLQEGKLMLYSINDILENRFEPVFSFMKKDIPFEGSTSNNIFHLCLVKDNLLMGTGIFDEGKYLFVEIDDNSKVDSIFYLSDYSFDPKKVDNRTKAMVYQPQIFLSPNNKYVLSIMGHGNRIEIIDIKNSPTIVNNFNIDNYFYTVLRNGLAGSDAKLTVKGLTVGGFVTNDYIVFPYSGRTREKYGNDYQFGNEIRVYNWDGILNKSFKVNRDIQFLSYNQKLNNLYAFTINPETYYPELVLFNDFSLDFE